MYFIKNSVKMLLIQATLLKIVIVCFMNYTDVEEKNEPTTTCCPPLSQVATQCVPRAKGCRLIWIYVEWQSVALCHSVFYCILFV